MHGEMINARKVLAGSEIEIPKKKYIWDGSFKIKPTKTRY